MTRNVRKVLEMKEIMFNPYIPPGGQGCPGASVSDEPYRAS